MVRIHWRAVGLTLQIALLLFPQGKIQSTSKELYEKLLQEMREYVVLYQHVLTTHSHLLSRHL